MRSYHGSIVLIKTSNSSKKYLKTKPGVSRLTKNQGVAFICPGFYTTSTFVTSQLTKYMEKNVHPVANPQDALTRFVGEQYVEWLVEYLNYEVSTWGSLDLISQSAPKLEKVKKFLGQRYIIDQIFFGGRDGDPGFVGFAEANLSESPEPLAEHVLDIINQRRQLDNPNAQVHKNKVWLNLLSTFGLSQDEVKRLEPKESARNYASELSDLYSNAEWQTVLAAFFAHEKLVHIEYEPVLTMLQTVLAGANIDAEALNGRVKSDNKYLVDARHMLERAAVDDESKSLIFDGLNRQLQARKDFLLAITKYLYE